MRNGRRKKNRDFRALVITLVIIAFLGILSSVGNSPVSSGINAASKGLFKLTASAAASNDSASPEELREQLEAQSSLRITPT